MKKHLHCFVLIFCILFIAASCKKDDTAVQKYLVNSQLVQGTIAGVNGPTTGAVNQELTFNIVWQNADSTVRFNNLLDSTVDNTRHIKLFAVTNVADSATYAKNLKSVFYKFKADTPGTYYLKFYKADNSEKTAIIDTVSIK